MPTREEVYYFGAGPAPLPTSVLQEASKVLLNYNETGIGITEISHRSADANAILEGAKSALQKLLDIPQSDGPDGYQILFLQGGGSGEFSAVVYHMISIWVADQFERLSSQGEQDAEVMQKLQNKVATDLRLDYFVTGSWSLKASQEAGRLVGADKVQIVTDARKHNNGKFGVIPSSQTWAASPNREDTALTYYCDNETVDGVEFPSSPKGHNLIADMSSNFLSRSVDIRSHKAIFGGAQKNIGTAGVTIVIVSNSILPPFAKTAQPELLRRLGLPIGPIVFDWPTISKNNSLYNTLPIFDVWVASQVMQRLLDRNPDASPRIAGQQGESEEKARLLYSVLDSSDLFRVVPDKSVRSRMNICLRIKNGDEAIEKQFLEGASKHGLLGLKGHRSVGGIRISNYNAVPIEAAVKLAKYIQDFANNYGGA